MLFDRILAALFDHSAKVVVSVLILGGAFIWLTPPITHPVSMVQARCQEQNLTVRVVKLEAGSPQEERFLAMVPGGNRERLPDGQKGDDWFRDDLYRPPEEQSSAERGPATAEGSGRMLRLLLASVVTLLYWLVLVFICDFREIVFPNMPRRAAWLCR